MPSFWNGVAGGTTWQGHVVVASGVWRRSKSRGATTAPRASCVTAVEAMIYDDSHAAAAFLFHLIFLPFCRFIRDSFQWGLERWHGLDAIASGGNSFWAGTEGHHQVSFHFISHLPLSPYRAEASELWDPDYTTTHC